VKVVARRTVNEAEPATGFAHQVEIEGGHSITVDEPATGGGTDTGPSPTRLLAASLASCTAVTMEIYAERKGWDIGAVEVDVNVDYEGFAPAAFTVTLRLSPDLSDEQRERLAVIAAKCPVHRVLAGETPVTISDHVESL
jgi:putative redox protein